MNWEQSDSSRLREYHQKSGGRLLYYLKSRIPLCQGKTIESVALEAKYKEGFEKVIKEIEDLLGAEDAPADPSAGSFTPM